MTFVKDKGVHSTPCPCGIFTEVGHPTVLCPQLQEEIEEVGSTPRQSRVELQPKYGLSIKLTNSIPTNTTFSTTKLSAKVATTSTSTRMCIKYVLRGHSKTSLANSTQTFQQNTKASIKILDQQISQDATFVSRLESQAKLHAQTKTNQGKMYLSSH